MKKTDNEKVRKLFNKALDKKKFVQFEPTAYLPDQCEEWIFLANFYRLRIFVEYSVADGSDKPRHIVVLPNDLIEDIQEIAEQEFGELEIPRIMGNVPKNKKEYSFDEKINRCFDDISGADAKFDSLNVLKALVQLSDLFEIINRKNNITEKMLDSGFNMVRLRADLNLAGYSEKTPTELLLDLETRDINPKDIVDIILCHLRENHEKDPQKHEFYIPDSILRLARREIYKKERPVRLEADVECKMIENEKRRARENRQKSETDINNAVIIPSHKKPLRITHQQPQ